MLTFPNGGRMIQSLAELPLELLGSDDVFIDYETTSGSPKEMSVNPWQHCGIAGIAFTADNHQGAWYFDWLRSDAETRVGVAQFIQDLVWTSARWINHHVKYDAHVGTNYGGLQIPEWVKLVCTIVRAKLVDSDRVTRGGYGLDVLCKDWLGHDISEFEIRLQPYLGKNNKDYGAIPSDILGEYACTDVIENRLLFHEINRRLPADCAGVAATEIEVTKLLYKLEQRGLKFEPLDLKIEHFKALNRISELDEELTQLTGRPVNVKSSDDCNEVLCGQYGLPIIKYTKDAEGEETEAASFDKHVLAAYEALPYAPHDVIKNMIEQRKLLQRCSLFFVPWQEYAPDGILHSEYNQVVRTGRMSCKSPNAQQIESYIKTLIIPRKGYSLVSTDASQIEFRFIVHYIEDLVAIKKFNDNPDEDFHILVAEMCEVDRKPAKTINFGTAFGEGKKKLISQIAADKGIVAAVKAEVEAMPNLRNDAERMVEFNRRVIARGEAVYDKYHAMLPTLKPTAKLAEQVCKSPLRRLGTVLDDKHAYGYIKNCYGRYRHLPYCFYRTDYKTKDPLDKAWLAFPTLNQSSAADLMKERLVALMAALHGLDVHLVAIVHDEIVLEVPNDIANDPRFKRDCVGILESPAVDLSVPIRWSIGVSDENWNDASKPLREGGKSSVQIYNKADCESFEWAR